MSWATQRASRLSPHSQFHSQREQDVSVCSLHVFLVFEWASFAAPGFLFSLIIKNKYDRIILLLLPEAEAD